MRAVLLSVMLLLPFGSNAQTAQLLMGEEDGCYWCARWNADIGEIYPKTDKGALAPLMRINIRDPLPDGVSLKSKIIYTPTFVLLVDGVEHGRIEGYPGEDFFWGLLSMLMAEANLRGDGST
ncbi:MAG: hypothetical protein AAF714_04600 [Pseudomonadota bacterium]